MPRLDIKTIVTRSISIALPALMLFGCGTIRIKDPGQLAEVGDPLVFDGRRLLADFATRRAQIDREISGAKVEEIETTGRIATSKALSFGIDVSVLQDQKTIDVYRDAQQASTDSIANSIEMQSLVKNNAQAKIDAETSFAETTVRMNDLRVELLTEQIGIYQTLLSAFTTELEEFDKAAELSKSEEESAIDNATDEVKEAEAEAEAKKNEEERMEQRVKIIAKIDEVRQEMAVTGSTLSKPEYTGITETFTTVDPPKNPLPKSDSSVASDLKFDNSSLEEIAAKLAALGVGTSTRAEKFQQYQSYLDELFATRNGFLLDDSHGTLGKRYVRLTFPVYVPPSNSGDHVEVGFTVKKGSGVSVKNGRMSGLNRDTLIKALQLLAQSLDFPELKSDENKLSSELNQIRSSLNSIYIDAECKNSGNTLFSIDNKGELETGTAVILTGGKSLELNWRAYKAAEKVGITLVGRQCLVFNSAEGLWVPIGLPKDDLNTVNKAITIYSVSPKVDREKIDRTSTELFNIGVSIAAAYGSKRELGSASIGGKYAKESFAQAALRAPVVASFTRNTNNNESARIFGWLIYPRVTLNSRGKVKFRQTGTNFYGTVDLSIPSDWEWLDVQVYAGDSRKNIRQIKIHVPELDEEESIAQYFSSPVVDNILDYGLLKKDAPFSFYLSGYNLWNSPTVLVGGKSAKNVEFFSGKSDSLLVSLVNLDGISCDYNSSRSQKSIRYHGSDYNPKETCAAKIMVFTGDGKAYAGSLLLDIREKKKKAASTTLKVPTYKGTIISASLKKGLLTVGLQETEKERLAIGSIASLKDDRKGKSSDGKTPIAEKESIDLTVISSKKVSKDKYDTIYIGRFLQNFCLKDAGKRAPKCPVVITTGKDKTKKLVFKGLMTIE